MGYIKDVKIGNDTHLIEPILYGRCSTSSSTAVKVVDIPNFELVDGIRIAVYFVNPNTASSPKLNVNNTGEKIISYRTSRESNSTAQVTTAALPILSGVQYFMYFTNSWLLEEDVLSLSKYKNDTAYGNLTFSGTVTLAADPTTNLEAATKQYVDTAVSGASASIEVVRLI